MPYIIEDEELERNNINLTENLLEGNLIEEKNEFLAYILKLGPTLLEKSINVIEELALSNEPGIGSNSWVFSGALTETGKPILSNDMHLGVQMPSIWYEIHLECELENNEKIYNASGFSFAGIPGIINGHNDYIAWGDTNLGSDVQDLYMWKRLIHIILMSIYTMVNGRV